jgi:tyrosinase
MFNLWSSANDPLFYLHHANLDRIWSIWQEQSSDNLYDMGGPIFPNGTGLTTLDYIMEMGQFMAPSLPIRTVMDTMNRNGRGILCYKYEAYNQP